MKAADHRKQREKRIRNIQLQWPMSGITNIPESNIWRKSAIFNAKSALAGAKMAIWQRISHPGVALAAGWRRGESRKLSAGVAAGWRKRNGWRLRKPCLALRGQPARLAGWRGENVDAVGSSLRHAASVAVRMHQRRHKPKTQKKLWRRESISRNGSTHIVATMALAVCGRIHLAAEKPGWRNCCRMASNNVS